MPCIDVSENENEYKEPGPSNSVYKLITAEEKRLADWDIAEVIFCGLGFIIKF
jgi:hypothetical protein